MLIAFRWFVKVIYVSMLYYFPLLISCFSVSNRSPLYRLLHVQFFLFRNGFQYGYRYETHEFEYFLHLTLKLLTLLQLLHSLLSPFSKREFNIAIYSRTIYFLSGISLQSARACVPLCLTNSILIPSAPPVCLFLLLFYCFFKLLRF
jgi:hypothetical protein